MKVGGCGEGSVTEGMGVRQSGRGAIEREWLDRASFQVRQVST
jgi:hypothetical protein